MAEARGKESEPEPTGSSVTTVAQDDKFEAYMKSLNLLLSDDENDVTLAGSKNLKDDSSSSFDSIDEDVKNAKKPNQNNEAERQNQNEKKDEIVENYFDQFLDDSLLKKKKEVKKEKDEIEKIQETSVILTTTSESDCSTFLSSSVLEEEEDKEALLLREQGLRPELSAKGWEPLPPEGIPRVPEGFIELAPNRIPTVGDAIREGTIKSCRGGEVVSPSEFYLILSQDHPDLMEKHIEEMSISYRDMMHGPLRAQILLEGGRMELEKGTVVAFVNRDDTARNEDEILRGIIIEKSPKQKKLDLMQNGTLYKVFCVDLGKYQNVNLWDMRLLDKIFFERAGLAIRCRLLLPASCEKYHNKKWDKRVISFIQLGIYQRRLKVKFVRKVEVDGEPVWEVSILETDTEDKTYKKYKDITVELLLLKMIKKFRKMDKDAEQGGGGFKGQDEV